ncbi:hypothetical protein MCHI_001837 [Candidatus Magnetoovum chiemensis]|nr:hypothetical protein MCHI_001837 [Candidatus Magnetoovum chiemensis]
MWSTVALLDSSPETKFNISSNFARIFFISSSGCNSYFLSFEYGDWISPLYIEKAWSSTQMKHTLIR